MKFLLRWKWTVGLVALTVFALAAPVFAFVLGAHALGWPNGFWVVLMIYGYTAFQAQVTAIVRGITKFRKARKTR